MKIEHAAMYVNDIETARDFFVKYLGGRPNDGYIESGVYKKERSQNQTVPIKDKVALTVKEAAEYSNIGINKLENLLRSPRSFFSLRTHCTHLYPRQVAKFPQMYSNLAKQTSE